MRRRVLLAAAVVLAVFGSVLAVAAAGGEERTRLRGPAGDAEFAGAVRLSLSPLVSQAVTFRTALSEATAAATPPPDSVIEGFRAWSVEFATARDLVSRLVAPPGRTVARDTAGLGAMFYREAALTMIGVKSGDDIAAWRTAAQRGSHLRVIGDRLFDASRRMLTPAGSGTVVLTGLPDPVPHFGQLGPDPQPDAPSTVPAKVWWKQHSSGLRRAAAAVSAVKQGDRAITQSALDVFGDELRGPLPAPAEPAEGVVLVRLSLLSAAEALAAPSESQPGLRLLAGELLDLGRQVLPETWQSR